MNVPIYASPYYDIARFIVTEQPEYAFSLRDITGGDENCVRVRRTSDNATEDFTPVEILRGDLVSWVGDGNEGFVERWYDQINVGNYYEQTNTGSQPQIVYNIGGTATLVRSYGDSGNLPSIDFGGLGYVANGFLEGAHFTPERDLLFIVVLKPAHNDPADDGYIFDNFTSSGRALLQDNFGDGTYTFINDTSSTTPDRLRADVPNDNLTLITARIKADTVTVENNQFEIYLNRELAASDNGVLLPYQPRTGDTIIGAGSGTGGEGFLGTISEILIYQNNNLDTTQEEVENNVLYYYRSDFKD